MLKEDVFPLADSLAYFFGHFLETNISENELQVMNFVQIVLML